MHRYNYKVGMHIAIAIYCRYCAMFRCPAEAYSTGFQTSKYKVPKQVYKTININGLLNKKAKKGFLNLISVFT